MKFAIPFSNGFQYLDDPEVQFNIIYKPKIKQLENFIQKYGSHRINLIMSDFNQNSDSQIITALREKFSDCDLVVSLPTYNAYDEELLNELKIPHYYQQLVTTWDRFQGFLTLSVTDIFVAEELAFSAEILSSNAKEKGISLRCYCNVCQSSWDQTPSLKTFFIRPQDINLYAKYFDVFQFFVDRRETNKVNVLYRVYSKEKRWIGRLDEIIVGYEGDDYSAFILPRFGEKRLNCGKRCMKNSHCSLCDHMASAGELLRQNNFYIRVENEEES